MIHGSLLSQFLNVIAIMQVVNLYPALIVTHAASINTVVGESISIQLIQSLY